MGPIPDSLPGETPAELARAVVNWIVTNKKGAWGGVLLQVDWMVEVVEVAILEAVLASQASRSND